MARKEAAMINGLAKRKGWLDCIGPEQRDAIIVKVVNIILNPASTPREITSATSTLATFDRLDVERIKIDLITGDTETVIETQPFQYEIVDGTKEAADDSDVA